MATQIVELSGDEAALLRSYDRAVKKQAELEAKLRAGGAAGDAAGTQIEEALARVERANDKALKGLLGDLKKLGPEGQAAADAMKGHFVDAGKAGYRSMDQVLDQIRAIDPAAADAANSVVAAMKRSTDDSANMFRWFSASAITEIAGIASAYIGVGEAISAVTQFLEEQKESAREAKAAHLDLAAAQENAIKNLSGLSKADRASLLQRAPAVSMATGVEPAFITQALGEVASTGMSDPAQIESTVAAAARLNRLSPEDLPAVAAGTADILAKTGLLDVRQAVSLMTTTGSASRVDAASLQETLPRALGAGVSTVPQQDREQAARETAALFAQASNMATDATGMSTATFTIDFVSRMDRFFANLQREQVRASSQIELIDRQIAKGSDTEFDRLERQELQRFVADAKAVTDPGTQFGRLGILQSSTALASKFTGESGFGEKQFATFLTTILDGSSEASKGLQSMKEQIKADAATYEALAKELESATGPIALAVGKKTEDAQMKSLDASRTEQSLSSQFNQATQDALRKSRGMDVTGFGNYMSDWMSGSTRSAPDAALQNILALEARAAELRGGGITQDEAKLITKIEGTIGTIFTTLENSASSLDPALAQGAAATTRRSRAAFEARFGPQGQVIPANDEMVAILTRLEAIMTKIAESNQAMVQPTLDTAETARRVPPVTPALGAQAP